MVRGVVRAGYALSIFIPISFVCVVPYEAVRWAMIAVATVLSGLFLLLNFKGPIFDVAGAKCELPVSPHPQTDLHTQSGPLEASVTFANTCCIVSASMRLEALAFTVGVFNSYRPILCRTVSAIEQSVVLF